MDRIYRIKEIILPILSILLKFFGGELE